MPRASPRRTRVPPWAAHRALSFVDTRTQRGLLVAGLRAELIADRGGDPPAAQRLLIDLAVFNAVRVAELAQAWLSGAPTRPETLVELRAWSAELRASLRTLGIDRIEAAPPSLAKLIADDVRLGLPP